MEPKDSIREYFVRSEMRAGRIEDSNAVDTGIQQAMRHNHHASLTYFMKRKMYIGQRISGEEAA